MREGPLQLPLRPIEVSAGKNVSRILEEMSGTGFQGRTLGEAVRVWEKAIRAEDTVIFMGLAGSMSTTGQWKVVKWLIEKRFVDVLVSTGANVSEDLIEAMGMKYWQSSHNFDDAELRSQRIYRFHDVLVREEDYLKMEEMVAEFMLSLDRSRVYTSAEYLHLFGGWLNSRGVDGIVTSAYRAGVPVFVPALVDSGYGVAYLVNRWRDSSFGLLIDHFRDFEQMVRIRSRFRDSAAVFIGGGVPKDIIQLVAVSVDVLTNGDLTKTRPHRFAMQVTTDSPHWGGLSGATLEEAVSWGKEAKDSYKVQCFADATIALPLIAHALAERVPEGRRGPDLSWVFSGLK
ncbi:MAG: deoxyhypusine synthase family protein [Thaumarchaeota archaeon]|nr:deoxyhypusine synthase family protein [Candidatus Calditenuaceae archaeon]MDW8042503.1 deoxyhypusine synthase family protein [Nitrososphaerota archaeon]